MKFFLRGPVRALSLLALVISALVVSGVSPASAHTGLISSDPRDGAELAAPPIAVTFVFEQDLLPDFVNFSVASSAGDPITVVGIRVESSSAVLPWPADAPGGTYTVAYRVVSQDGHPVSGAITFSYIQESPSPTPTSSSASPTPTSSSSAPITSATGSPGPDPTQTSGPDPTDSTGSATPTRSPDVNPASSTSSAVWIIAGAAIIIIAVIAIIALVFRRR